MNDDKERFICNGKDECMRAPYNMQLGYCCHLIPHRYNLIDGMRPCTEMECRVLKHKVQCEKVI